MIARVEHIRASDLCTRGARKWFMSHGLSWDDFLTNGIEVAVLETLNDGLADRVIATVRKESDNG